MGELEKLKDDLMKVTSKRNRLSEKIQDIEDSKVIPELKIKYEGKFWKYRNSYSSDNQWWLYSYCKKVNGVNSANFQTFQTDSYGKVEFETKTDTGLSLCQQEITKIEFNTALRKIKRKLADISQG